MAMDAARWERIKELFERAAALDAHEREALLRQEAGADEELIEEVRSLLAAAEEPEGLLERPAYENFSGDIEADKPEARLGQVVGTWRIQERIGAGGMATVYRGERADDAYEQQVAVKFLRPGFDSGNLLRRFLNERQTLASLDHPNIAHLLDGGTTSEGQPYLVMEYVKGAPLLHYCRDQKLDLASRIRLFEKICGAVAYAHRNLVVHRDLKPANILVTDHAEPKLLDFGIAKILDSKHIPGDTELTIAPLSVMTPEYASPEQVRGQVITTASDVYSLGVILYELLAGVPPYTLTTRSIYDIERVICEGEPERPNLAARRREEASPVMADELIGDLDAIVLMAMRKEVERRYASVDALADDLRRYRNGLPVQASPDSVSYRVNKYLRRHRYGVGASVLVLLSLIGGLVGVGWQARIAASEAKKALDKATTLGRVSEFLVGLFEASDPWAGPAAAETPVRVIVERGAEQLGPILETEPAVQAELRVVLGRVLLNFNQDAQAEDDLRNAVELARGLGKEGREVLASALNWYGIALRRLHEFDLAVESLRESVALHESVRRGAHEELAGAWNALGLALIEQAVFGGGEADPLVFEEARAALRRGLDMRRELGLEQEVAMSLGNLGAAHRAEGQVADRDGYSERATRAYLAAEPLFRDSLEQYVEALGAAHPDVATTRNNLGMLLRDLGDVAISDLDREARYQEGEAEVRKAIELGREYLGEDHPYVASWWNNLGLLLNSQERYAEARDAIRQAVAIAERRLDVDHPIRARFEDNLAAVESNLSAGDES